MRLCQFVGRVALILLSGLVVVESATPVTAQEATPDEKYLLGDLGREALAESGYTVQAFGIYDLWSNPRGGVKRDTSILGVLNATLEIDTEKAGLWSGGQFFAYTLWVHGEQPVRSVGDFQYSNNFDAPETFELYQLWYGQDLLGGRLNILAGIHDFSTEMAVIPSGFSLMNSSFLTPPTITQRFQSFFPQTSLGARAKVLLSDELYGYVGVYDGHPTNPNYPRTASYGVSRQGGLFSISEVGWQTAEDAEFLGKVGLGGWYSSTSQNDVRGETQDSNYGGYIIAEHHLIGEEEDSKQGLSAFGQFSIANASRNFNSYYYGVGVSYTGLFECRDADVLTLAFNTAHTSGAARQGELGFEAYERVFEVAYRANVLPWLVLMPDVQYIKNPGMARGVDDAVVLYLRSEIAF
jgi:porin